MDERRCRYCQKGFQPSKFQPRQQVCGTPDCQLQRRSDYHRQKIAPTPYTARSAGTARASGAPAIPVIGNGIATRTPPLRNTTASNKVRDRKRRLCLLANNTSALDLKRSAAQIWLVGHGAAQLANNNSAPAQIWVIEALPPRSVPAAGSCQQQPPSTAVPAA